MFNVLLVDDEPWSLVTLRNAFNWKAFGFEIVKETTNSLEAFDILCNETIHAAFVDIRMPGMSGLELIKAIRERDIDIEFIIVSGFSEFSYAQQALKEGVFDYCLKPIEEEKTDDLLRKLSEFLEAKQISKDIGLYELLLECDKNISDILISKEFKTTSNKYCIVAENLKNVEEHSGLALSGFSNKLALNLGLGKHCYIIGNNDLSSEEVIKGINIWYSPDKANIGLSSIATGIESLPRLAKEADIASKSFFITKSYGIYQYSVTDYHISNEILVKVFYILDNHELNELKSIIEKIPGIFAANNLGIEDATYFWNQFVAFLLKKHSKSDFLSDLEFSTYDVIFNKFDDINMLCGYLSDMIIFFEERKANSNPANTYINSNITDMIDFINQNYNRKLYLKELAETVHFSLTYCCEIFKKVTGTTFTQYITGLRMKKASELLLNSQLSLAEICSEIGYNDYFYFNNVFKKHFGTSPIKYRKIKDAGM